MVSYVVVDGWLLLVLLALYKRSKTRKMCRRHKRPDLGTQSGLLSVANLWPIAPRAHNHQARLSKLVTTWSPTFRPPVDREYDDRRHDVHGPV